MSIETSRARSCKIYFDVERHFIVNYSPAQNISYPEITFSNPVTFRGLKKQIEDFFYLKKYYF